MEVMKKTFGVIGVVLVAVAIISLSVNFGFASQNGINGSNKTTVNKKFELPSRLHKDGEGFYEIGRMLTPRYFHSAIKMNNDKIFIVGGYNKNGLLLDSTEIFDPKTGKTVYGPKLKYPRHSIALKNLSNGNILIVGGEAHSSKYEEIVEIYNPNINKIFELNNKLIMEISQYLIKPVVEQITKDEIFIAKTFTAMGDYCIYNIRNNKLTCKDINTQGIFFNQYCGKVNDELYFLWGSNIIVVNIKNKGNFYNTYKKYKNEEYFSFREPVGILLKNKKTIVIFHDVAISLFNIETKTYSNAPRPLYIDGISDLFLLENDNILIFRSYTGVNSQVLEFNPKTFNIKYKNYLTPNILATVINLNDDELLYMGGANRNKYRWITNVSDKIYVWKKEKE